MSTLYVAGLVTNGQRVALIKSAKRGAWELPGGAAEPGETWQAALSREVREEAGLDVASDLWALEAVLHIDGALVIVARVEAHGDLVPGSDAAAASWWPRGALPLDISPLASRKVLFDWQAETPLVHVDSEEIADMLERTAEGPLAAVGRDLRKLLAEVLERRKTERRLREIVDNREERDATLRRLERRWLEPGQTHTDLPGRLQALAHAHADLPAFGWNRLAVTEVERAPVSPTRGQAGEREMSEHLKIYGYSDDGVIIEGWLKDQLGYYDKPIRIEIGSPTTGGIAITLAYGSEQNGRRAGGTWSVAISPLDEEVVCPWPVEFDAAGNDKKGHERGKWRGYSFGVVVRCPSGTLVRAWQGDEERAIKGLAFVAQTAPEKG